MFTILSETVEFEMVEANGILHAGSTFSAESLLRTATFATSNHLFSYLIQKSNSNRVHSNNSRVRGNHDAQSQ